MTLNYFLAAIRRYWYMLVIGAVAGAGGAMLIGSVAPKTYNATAQIILSAPKVPDPTASNAYVRDRMPTYAQFIEAEPVLANARGLLGTDKSTAFLADHIDARVEVSTVLITITGSWDTAQGAADLANAVAVSYAQVAPRLDNVDDPLLRSDIVQPAVAPSGQAGMSPMSLLVVGATGGLTAGLLAAILLRIFWPYARTVEDISAACDAQVLGAVGIPFDPESSISSTHSSDNAASFPLVFSRAGLGVNSADGPRIVLVVSTAGGAHAAAVVWGLAATAAASGRHCLLISADSASHLELETQLGLLSTAEAACPPRLLMLDELGVPEHGVLLPDRVRKTIHNSANSQDLVLIAAPSLEADPNAHAFARIAHQTLLVTPLHHSRLKRVQAYARLLEQAHASALGLVVTEPNRGLSKRPLPVGNGAELIGAQP